jgi:hypothetical protein
MNDANALKFALERTAALKKTYAKVVLSALADNVSDGTPIPGKALLLLRTARQMRKEKSE